MLPGTGTKGIRGKPPRGRGAGGGNAGNEGRATGSVRGNRVGARLDRCRGATAAGSRAGGTAPGVAGRGGAPRARRAAGRRTGPRRSAERGSERAGRGRGVPAVDLHRRGRPKTAV